MARYRKIDVRMWNDRKFRELSDNGKLAFILLLTHPDTTQIGTIRTRVSNLADELGWQRDAMSHAIQEVTLNGMIDVDEKAGLMVINNFLKYNAPSSPNAFKSWCELIDLMPECDLLDKHVARLKTFLDGLSVGMRNAIPNDLIDAIKDAMSRTNGQTCRIQEQEQDQEQDKDKEIHTHEHHRKASETFAGRECEKPVSLKTEAIEEELPLEEQGASVSKKEIVEPKPKKEVKTQRLQKPEELTGEFWQDFLAYRKQKKAPVTERVVSLLRKEAKTAGWKLEEVINEMMVRNWTGFKAEWVEAKDPNAVWVKTEDYQPELPPVTYATKARDKFDKIMARSTYAYDIKDLSKLEKVVNKGAK